MQSTIDKLKEKPKEQRTAVAGGIATAVVALLLIGWGFFYLKKILAERPPEDYVSSDTNDFGSLREVDTSSLGGGGSYDSYNDNPFGESRDNF